MLLTFGDLQMEQEIGNTITRKKLKLTTATAKSVTEELASDALKGSELVIVLKSADTQIEEIKEVLSNIDAEIERRGDTLFGDEKHNLKNRCEKVLKSLISAKQLRKRLLARIAGESLVVIPPAFNGSDNPEIMRLASDLRIKEAEHAHQLKLDSMAKSNAYQKELQEMELRAFGKCLASISEGIEDGYLTLDAIQIMIKRCFERKNLELEEIKDLT